MSIDAKGVEKLAQLARLDISEKDIAATTRSIGEVLKLVDQLQQLDTRQIEPLSHPLDAKQRLRADRVTETNQRDAFEALAPLCEDGLYLVPRVIE